MLTILFEGWTHFPHSYSIVNVNQLVVMARMTDTVKVYVTDRPAYNPAWPVFSSMENLVLTADEQALLNGMEVWDGKAPVDVIWRSWFPYDLSVPKLEGVPAAVQYTAEYRVFNADYLLSDEAIAGFKERCEQGKAVGITPSNWCTQAFGDAKNSRIVPHGCDCTKFFPHPEGGHEIREGLHIPRDAFVFLNVGAMTENKNIKTLIYAFYLIARQDPRVWMVLKGIDDLYACQKMVTDTIDELVEKGCIKKELWNTDMGQRLVYVGGTLGYKFLNNVYNCADCYVTPYIAEGFNIPALEAQACGLPVIATAGGPTDEFLSRDGSTIYIPSTTFLVPGSGYQLHVTTDDLVASMTRAIREKNELKTIALQNGVAHVRDNYTWVHATNKLIEVLTSLAHK